MSERHNRSRRLRTLELASALMLAGCSGSPDTHYFILSAIPQSPPVTSGAALRVGIGAVNLPKILDEPQMARRIGQNELVYAEYDRWAASLDDLVRHALAEDLSSDLGVTVTPTAPEGNEPGHRVIAIDIDRFEADGAGTVSLDARWTAAASDPAGSGYETGEANLTTPTEGLSADAVAHAMSVALGALASRIAVSLQAAGTAPATPHR